MPSKSSPKEAHRLNRFLAQKVDEQLCASPDLAEWADPSSLHKMALCFSGKALKNEPTASPLAHRFCRLISLHKTLYPSYDANWKKCGVQPISDEPTWRYVVAGLLSLLVDRMEKESEHDSGVRGFVRG